MSKSMVNEIKNEPQNDAMRLINWLFNYNQFMFTRLLVADSLGCFPCDIDIIRFTTYINKVSVKNILKRKVCKNWENFEITIWWFHEILKPSLAFLTLITFQTIPNLTFPFARFFRVRAHRKYFFSITIFLHRFVIASFMLCSHHVWELIARVTLITFEAPHTLLSLDMIESEQKRTLLIFFCGNFSLTSCLVYVVNKSQLNEHETISIFIRSPSSSLCAAFTMHSLDLHESKMPCDAMSVLSTSKKI